MGARRGQDPHRQGMLAGWAWRGLAERSGLKRRRVCEAQRPRLADQLRSEITGQPWPSAWARRVSSGSTATGLLTLPRSGRSLWESL